MSLLLVLLSCGCNLTDDDSSEWSIDDDAAFSSDVAATPPRIPDAFARVDASSLDTGEDVDAEVGIPESPPPTPQLPEIGRCAGELDVASYRPGGPVAAISAALAPQVDKGTAYFHQIVDGTAQIFGQKVGSGTSRQLTDEQQHVWLEYADGGYFIARTRADDVGQQPVFQVRDDTGGLVSQVRGFGVNGVARSWYSGAPANSFDGSRLVMRGRNTHHFSRSGDLVGELDASSGHVVLSRPALTNDGLVYGGGHVTQGPPGPVEFSPADIYRWTPNEGSTRLTDTPADEKYVWWHGGAIYWATDEAIFAKHADGEPFVLHSGRCGPPHAADGLVAFACVAPDVEPVEDDGGRAHLSELFVSDGHHTRQIPLDGDRRLLHNVRITANAAPHEPPPPPTAG